jgi:hypothetical protein
MPPRRFSAGVFCASMKKNRNDARVAQLVERFSYTELAGGSNPSTRTKIELEGF